ncbi:MAG: c-type cytochrome domain-containing protein [Flavobacteriaceae bacterium]
MDHLLQLIGRFHPLLVHLPIGFILMGLLICWNKTKFKDVEKIIQFIFFWGTISGVLSLISGFLQYQQEGYLWENINTHFYAGSLTLLLTLGFYIYLRDAKPFNRIPESFYTFGLLVCLLLTGHLGGNITHGEDHLIEPLPSSVLSVLSPQKNKKKNLLTASSYKEKPIYPYLIHPILESKCIQCHNPKKSKGGLQMHTLTALKRGGKNGSILNVEFPNKSELFKRIHLPLNEKKHMPPKSREQLSKAEIKMLSQWLALGSPEETPIGSLNLKVEWITPFLSKPNTNVYPDVTLAIPNKKAIELLKQKGVLVRPVYESANILSVNTINYPGFNDADIALLNELKEHIVELNLSHSAVSDSIFKNLSTFTHLTQLKLDFTSITGKGIQALENLSYLKQLHLTNTSLRREFIENLIEFSHLEKVYLFQPNRDLLSEIRLPKEVLKRFDFGHYQLQNLASDSIVY